MAKNNIICISPPGCAVLPRFGYWNAGRYQLGVRAVSKVNFSTMMFNMCK
jgi:hypothetical protein